MPGIGGETASLHPPGTRPANAFLSLHEGDAARDGCFAGTGECRARGLDPRRGACMGTAWKTAGSREDGGSGRWRCCGCRPGSWRRQWFASCRRRDPRTVAQLQKATGWQPHSVRAALSGLRQEGSRHPAGAERKGRHRLQDRRTMNRHADEDQDRVATREPARNDADDVDACR